MDTLDLAWIAFCPFPEEAAVHSRCAEKVKGYRFESQCINNSLQYQRIYCTDYGIRVEPKNGVYL